MFQVYSIDLVHTKSCQEEAKLEDIDHALKIECDPPWYSVQACLKWSFWKVFTDFINYQAHPLFKVNFFMVILSQMFQLDFQSWNLIENRTFKYSFILES